jgi:pimeloyl-ACP methyl ester carboxylesterase
MKLSQVLGYWGVLLLWLPWVARAQQPLPGESVGYVEQKVAVRAYAGLPFRLSMRARVDSTRTGGAKVDVAAFVFDHRHALVGIHARQGPPARAEHWQPYTLSQRLAPTADTLLLRLYYYLNGTFAFDDVQLEVQRDQQWQRVPLQNGDFEAPLAPDQPLPPGWRVDAPLAGFAPHAQREPSGNGYLEVVGQGIVYYGHDRVAGHYVTANGVRLYYETYGQGPPLLLLHGNGESIGSFRHQIGAFAKHYRVLAVDSRDHGQSAATHGKLTYDLLADDMQALLDSLRIPAAHIVGWSDGGNTGLSLALRYPRRVKSLVTMGANLYADTTAVDAKMLKEYRQTYRVASALGVLHKKFRRFRRLTALALHYPRWQPTELAAIRAPVLVLAGERDIIKRAHTLLIGQHIAGAHVQFLPGLTHYAPQENPQLFNETVLHFLQQLTDH